MKIFSKLLICAVFAACIPSICQAEVWNVTQGGHSVWRGTWTVKYVSPQGVKYFDCALHDGSYILTANAEVVMMGDEVMARQYNMSTGNTCAFKGVKKGDHISGSEVCNSAPGTYDWYADITTATG